MFLKNYKRLIFLLSGTVLLLLCLFMPMVQPIIQQARIDYIVDPGHGLPDGGAVAPDGTTEQEINLTIAKKLYAKYPSGHAIITRNDQQGLSLTEGSIREKKISDMKQRVSLINQHKDALLISIHMNTYPNQSVYGCQVFYRKGDPISLKIATALQNCINEQLQPNHPKKIKTISDSLYLFKNTTNSAILIECGFLTNPEDLTKLKNEEFQEKLTALIYQTTQAVRE